jgi:hypothetical protein
VRGKEPEKHELEKKKLNEKRVGREKRLQKGGKKKILINYSNQEEAIKVKN